MEKKELYFVTGNNNKFNEVLRSFQQEDLNYTMEQLKMDPTEIQAETVSGKNKYSVA